MKPGVSDPSMYIFCPYVKSVTTLKTWKTWLSTSFNVKAYPVRDTQLSRICLLCLLWYCLMKTQCLLCPSNTGLLAGFPFQMASLFVTFVLVSPSFWIPFPWPFLWLTPSPDSLQCTKKFLTDDIMQLLFLVIFTPFAALFYLSTCNTTALCWHTIYFISCFFHYFLLSCRETGISGSCLLLCHNASYCL